ncbi:apolipoprotein N-acyltransferase [Chitinivorax sp. B]|uniref:apolipoprotein N-acyltransferase n=1 Tax=Chitinivorax sp. B TaxID=2502235 RepID=UPI0010F48769|nr:apolipoprotein N-acyltransferase [Chitinivorax sp. B]
MLIGILGSSILCGLYAYGGMGWVLGFVALVPWLRSLNASKTLGGTLLSAYLMTVAYTIAVFAWFGAAIGNYTQVGEATGLLVLILMAPLFQPQIIAFALTRHLLARRYGPVLQALAGAAAWVATERLIPKLLSDTLGYGLYPAVLIRQAADLIGSAGLTYLLLLSNEALTAAWAQRACGIKAVLKPIAVCFTIPALLAGYGWSTSAASTGRDAKPVRVGLIQSNLVAYERMRSEQGTFAVVREILDTHYAMSYDAVERQRADAVLWSETVYPTTFGRPKNQVGAVLDQEILDIVRSAGVPILFGTYDRDDAGEYNATAFVTPNHGLLGMYRKSRLFPLTEYVPSWLDGPTFRRLLPWTGTWKPGSGARVFPLQLKDGREIPVLPLICLDDVDTNLAINGARLGAQAIMSMSNDSWFTQHPHGASLHQAVAAFRSIETRLPQFRVTTNGYSAVIDPSGKVIAGSLMGERTLVIGALPVQAPPLTLMVRWGDWVGLACAAFLALLAATALLPQWHHQVGGGNQPVIDWSTNHINVTVLPMAARVVAGLLRAFARCSLIWIAFAMLMDDNLRAHTLAQIRLFGSLFLLPEAVAWFVLLAFTAKANIQNGQLVLSHGTRQLALPLSDIAAVALWWLPLPGPGLTLRLTSGERWRYGLALHNPSILAQALAMSGTTFQPSKAPSFLTSFTRAREAAKPGRIAHPTVKFLLFPLLLALPAFNLHQHIAYGSLLGEYYTFGPKAYLTTLALWWVTWTIGMAATATILRVGIEAITFMAALLRPQQATDTRYLVERMGLVTLYLGIPIWLLVRITGAN